MLRSTLAFYALFARVLAGTVLWDGRFNDLASSDDLTKWSFSSQVGPYQYYIHGDSPVGKYISLDATYKNPADAASSKGAKFTIDGTSYWHGQTMRRTELIPQTSAAINKGQVYYHFSVKRTGTNAPNTKDEHQVCFFESHFTELKYGRASGQQGAGDDQLHWDVGGQSQWNTTFGQDVWHNVAYAIDFDAGTVGFWHSTGADELKQAGMPKSASTSSNGADWHLGILRLPNNSGGSGSGSADDSGPEDWYFSGVYIESGPMTTAVTGPSGGASSGSAPTTNGTASDSAGSGRTDASGDGTGGASSSGMGGAGAGSGSPTTLVTSTTAAPLTFSTPEPPTAGNGASGGAMTSGSGSNSTGSTVTSGGTGGTGSAGSAGDGSSGGTGTQSDGPSEGAGSNSTSGSAGNTGGDGTQGGGQSGAAVGDQASGGSGSGSSSSSGSKISSNQDAVHVMQLILDWVQNS